MEEFTKIAVTAGISEMIKLVISTYIKPRLELLNINNKLGFEDKFNEYMERSYNSNLYMNTIAFKNQQKTIDDLYIPLNVSKCSTNNKDNVRICIDRYHDNFVPHYSKVLLVDSAGMGKSTILKYLYLSIIKENKGIPVLIELRKLKVDTSIIDFIVSEINGIKEYFSKKEILDLIEEGGFVFFFDGYDEIIDENKKEVTENLQNFISKTSTTKNLSNNFVISSRDENALSCFSDFQRFDIKALTKKEAYELICKYDNNGELSKELIRSLNGEENLRIIDEFLVNPLMVSLLYIAFQYKRVVPYKKQIFYRQVYDALFQDHDRTKGGAYVHPKNSKLDIEDFHRVLRILGFITLSKGISYCKEELIKIVNKAKSMAVGIQFKANDFIYDIVHAVPIFIKDGVEYRWIHKSFQEYFAASYICYDSKEKQDVYLWTMIQGEKISKYYNVLDFCYDIDYKEFRKAIVYPIIKEFIEYYDSSYTDKKYESYDRRVLDIRKNINFIYDEVYIGFFDKDKSGKRYISSDIFEQWDKSRLSKRRIIHTKYFNMAIGCYSKDKDLDVLIDLLTSKNSSIVKRVRSEDDLIDLYRSVESFDSDKYILSIENENTTNEEETFGLLNEFLIVFNHSNKINLSREKYIFNYDECVKLKNQIEEESSFEEDIFL
ncbi:NACHT domain-containing protein [Clostridium kluyveri]|uniref:Uncharacterized protein n=2 Tax=Clostridium kluyveri TaxID=1534 RepID=A5MYN6_CLOK5|nr:NACHT domain-containing protein [Clostridium kluyveri]ABS30663.1 Conserved hypothetical protein [Clostridium kluyveri DSM 555]EDK33982.1 Conserved hypothetical protein [Clostridium kluyveri DSM 555]BAH06787.1 hypothetical protein CKR_1736 [Clostridium kluyveri NBRC 12016]